MPVLLEKPTSSAFLMSLHYLFPVFLLFFFMIFLATWSIYTSETVDPTKESILFARRKSSISKPNIPSGRELHRVPNKPLLSSFARSMFNWALVGLTLTYVSFFLALFFYFVKRKRSINENYIDPRCCEFDPSCIGEEGLVGWSGHSCKLITPR